MGCAGSGGLGLGGCFLGGLGLRRLEAGQFDGEHARVLGCAGSGGLGLGGCFLGGLGLEAGEFDGEHARVFGRVGSGRLGCLDRTVLRPGISDGRERCVRAALGGGPRHGLVRKHRQKLGLVAGQVSLLNGLQQLGLVFGQAPVLESLQDLRLVRGGVFVAEGRQELGSVPLHGHVGLRVRGGRTSERAGLIEPGLGCHVRLALGSRQSRVIREHAHECRHRLVRGAGGLRGLALRGRRATTEAEALLLRLLRRALRRRLRGALLGRHRACLRLPHETGLARGQVRGRGLRGRVRRGRGGRR